jgi:N-acetylmuramoyl-L-alanine amidase
MMEGKVMNEKLKARWQKIGRSKIFVIVGVILLVTVLVVSGSGVVQAITLKQGQTGDEVRQLQQQLKNWGYYMSGKADGIYGSATADAVRKFQRDQGLTTDGMAGPVTLRALGLNSLAAATSSSSSNSGATTGSDLNLLARAIHAEAEGEPYIGKVAVGAVLLNRIKSSEFPNTLSGVIYQSLAIESVSNGRMNDYAGQESVHAAQDAINGWDPTYGCLYFWNPATATSKWIWTRQIVVTYGNHVFGK